MDSYTTWNIAFLSMRVALHQQQWDPFLLANGMGIFLGFRTAFAQGLDENMRKKISGLGFPLSRSEFVTLDHVLHTLPPVILLAGMVRRRQRCHPMNAVYSMVLSSWFAFRQQASLDVSTLYMPHPFYRGVIAFAVGILATPPLVDALIARSRRKLLLCILALLLPYLSTKLVCRAATARKPRPQLLAAEACQLPVTTDAPGRTPTCCRSTILRRLLRGRTSSSRLCAQRSQRPQTGCLVCSRRPPWSCGTLDVIVRSKARRPGIGMPAA